jgi:simple sugar transport system ATP-binding protein
MVGREVSLRGEHSAFGLVGEAPDLEPVPSPPTPTDHEAGWNRAEAVMSPATEAVPALRISGASLRGRDGRVLLDNLTLDVEPGEVVGLAGVEGNGQRVLGDVLSSLLALDAGSVQVDGRAVVTGRAGAMEAAGVAVIPEDRHDSGCVLDFTVAENLFLTDPHRVARRRLMDHRRMRDQAADLIERFAIGCQGPDAPMWSLSGGNQQRVVLARELSQQPRVLVAAQPTRGLDVGAIEYMSDRLRLVAADGVGVLLISTELEEILDLADRVAVISGGRIVGEMERGQVDLDRLGLLMGGATAAAGSTP